MESRARTQGRLLDGSGDLGVVIGEIRGAVSVQGVRTQALCLLEKLSHLGPGARATGERRSLIERLEDTKKLQAYNQAYRQRGLARIGRAFVT